MPDAIVAPLAQAKQQISPGRIEATVHDLQSILQTNPDHAEALHGAAISLMQLEEPRLLAYPGRLARRYPNAALACWRLPNTACPGDGRAQTRIVAMHAGMGSTRIAPGWHAPCIVCRESLSRPCWRAWRRHAGELRWRAPLPRLRVRRPMKCRGVTAEADVDQTWLGMAAGTIVLVVAVVGVVAHYLRERRRADFLRNFDHHEWWQRKHGAACPSSRTLRANKYNAWK
ncbi:hypothetical protein [Paraburkholderia flagellata]|uniref:hypothetical protein n=1 Tax=Paraburkholderia flagellata TaxID=2883241 RepID=UPI001F37C3FB|nr:hypothetical protein [Paraburkholderia flagellata]